jgi:peptide/nickel transport system substrate-binding protein
MDRRSFLKTGAGAGALAATGGLSAPAYSQAANRTLRFVPQANLANFDPIWGTQYVVRNAAVLVWDTLYGFDEKLEPKRQMVENEEVSQDGKTWTFRLREGLRFHDNEPVRSRDVIASIIRWMPRDPMGQLLRAINEELVAVDDRTFRWVLKAPFPKMTMASARTRRRCASSCRSASRAPTASPRSAICRLRPDALRAERVGAGRPRRLPALRWLRAAERAAPPGSRAASA